MVIINTIYPKQLHTSATDSERFGRMVTISACRSPGAPSAKASYTVVKSFQTYLLLIIIFIFFQKLFIMVAGSITDYFLKNTFTIL